MFVFIHFRRLLSNTGRNEDKCEQTLKRKKEEKEENEKEKSPSKENGPHFSIYFFFTVFKTADSAFSYSSLTSFLARGKNGNFPVKSFPLPNADFSSLGVRQLLFFSPLQIFCWRNSMKSDKERRIKKIIAWSVRKRRSVCAPNLKKMKTV